jgi:hypothetical protein
VLLFRHLRAMGWRQECIAVSKTFEDRQSGDRRRPLQKTSFLGVHVASILPSTLRIRILRPIVGIVGGISLGHLVPGASYELSPTLARWLISEGYAEELPISSAATEPADNAPDSDDVFEELIGGVHVTQLSEAADHPKQRRVRKRRKQ